MQAALVNRHSRLCRFVVQGAETSVPRHAAVQTKTVASKEPVHPPSRREGAASSASRVRVRVYHGSARVHGRQLRLRY